MTRTLSRLVIVLAALGICGVASADSIDEVWMCTLEDDKTLDDVQAANSKWLAYVHKNVSKDVSSNVAAAIVGDSTGFIFVDRYPDLATWAKVKSRLNDDEDIDDLFEGISDCTKNTLYRMEATK